MNKNLEIDTWYDVAYPSVRNLAGALDWLKSLPRQNWKWVDFSSSLSVTGRWTLRFKYERDACEFALRFL